MSNDKKLLIKNREGLESETLLISGKSRSDTISSDNV